MKPLNIVIIVIVLLIGAVPATAQNGTDYGTKIDVYTTFDFMTHAPGDTLPDGSLSDEYYHRQSRYRGISTSKRNLSLSPDGEWIAFSTSSNNIWIVPAEGGEVILILEPEMYPESYKKGEVFIDAPLDHTFCFTTDSQEILYLKHIFDESKGATFSFSDQGSLSGCGNPYYVIESLNINTGEQRLVIEGGKNFSLSNDGRYLCYIRQDYMMYLDESMADHNGVPTIYDTLTGETRYLIKDIKSTWNSGGDFGRTGFLYNSIAISPDNSYFLISGMNYDKGEHKIYKVSFEGGEFEEFVDVIEYGMLGLIYDMSFSPDGQWLLFQAGFNNPVTDDYQTQLFICNTYTGDVYFLFGNIPPDYEYHTGGEWSPDGKKIFYIRRREYPYLLEEELEEEIGEEFNEIYAVDFNPENFPTNVEIEDVKPSGYTVLDIYPNPFNLSTTIEFTIPERSFAELIIYDITGRNIRKLLSRNIPAGVHSVIWDGRDENGMPVSSGVYISRLSSGKQVVSGKMIHIK